MAEGWLWLSILKEQARPSPISTRPAFSSPALASMRGESFGSFFSQTILFLYEQCSLHITEKILSSVKFGVRPSMDLIFSNSSSNRPSCLAVSTVVRVCSTGFGEMLVPQKYDTLNICA